MKVPKRRHAKVYYVYVIYTTSLGGTAQYIQKTSLPFHSKSLNKHNGDLQP